ncbi:hypothetical protein B0I18_101763 [Taibaiella chishuiensis]|uniref:Uncharacterized protein n=1 Tax=Taibaiella chishuiensis TaxID=1434707 RepID=A0A2P8DBQ2_9BACT|nr:hypothetical protein B0I18_101763 [Taibaiella chishuiensis]
MLIHLFHLELIFVLFLRGQSYTLNFQTKKYIFKNRQPREFINYWNTIPQSITGDYIFPQ